MINTLNKPYSESCDQNRDPILNIIQPLLKDKKKLLEIGSGTGQHAVYFAQKMPHLQWYTSDQTIYHAGITQWISDANLANTHLPITLNVSENTWPDLDIDCIFSANTVHIMSWDNVKDLFHHVGQLLPNNGLFILYGPFNYDNTYTSQSNANFDAWLKQRDIKSAIRDFEAINQLAADASMALKQDYKMPANNRILVWEKTA